METLDDDEAKSYGGDINVPKEDGMIRISTYNPNGIKKGQLKLQLQAAIDLQVDIQCYSEVNCDTNKGYINQRFIEETKQMDKSTKSVWKSSKVPAVYEYKPGGTGIVTTRRR